MPRYELTHATKRKLKDAGLAASHDAPTNTYTMYESKAHGKVVSLLPTNDTEVCEVLDEYLKLKK